MTADVLIAAADAKDTWANRVEALTLAATPGPWEADVDGVWVNALPEDPQDGAPSIDVSTLRHSADAAFIAALNPAETLRLVAEARAVAAWLRAEAEAQGPRCHDMTFSACPSCAAHTARYVVARAILTTHTPATPLPRE